MTDKNLEIEVIKSEYLDIIININLKWNDQVTNLKNKLQIFIQKFNKLRKQRKRGLLLIIITHETNSLIYKNILFLLKLPSTLKMSNIVFVFKLVHSCAKKNENYTQ